MDSENVYTFTYFQCLSLELLKRRSKMSGFDLYMGQKLKIHQIWLKMVSNYSSENKVPKKNSCDNIICSITIATRQIY